MATATPDSRLVRRLALLVGLALLTRVPIWGAPPLSDESVHLLGSWELLRGGRLYLDFVDNKPPLLYVFYALPQLLLGRGLWVVRLATVLLALPAAAWAASTFYRHDRRGLWAAVLFLVLGACAPAEESLAVNTELLMLLPAAWAMVALGDLGSRTLARPVFAGVLLGLAALFKVTAVLWLPAAPLAVLLAGRPGARLRPAAVAAAGLAAGCALPLAATAGFFAASGRLEELLHWTLLHNLGYVSQLIALEEALGRAARGLLPWLVVTVPLWAAWLVLARRSRHRYRRALIVALTLLAAPALALGSRFYGHYFVQLLLPLALGAAPVVAWVARRPRSGVARAAAAFLGLALAGFTLVNAWLIHGRTDAIEGTRPLFAAVGRWLRADACYPGSTLFVWGLAPQLYLEADRPPASRFVLPQETISGYVPGRTPTAAGPPETPLARKHWDLLMGDLEGRHATYILDTGPSGFHRWDRYPLSRYPRLADYVRERFELAAVVEGVAMYRRRDCGKRAW